MKIACFNIQNLFHRDKSFINLRTSHCLTNWVNELDTLMRKRTKVIHDYDRIRELSFLLGFEKIEHSRYAVLRRRNGILYFQEKGFSQEMKASELTDWNGWVALGTVPIHPEAVANKARAVAEIDADVLLLKEVEDRASLSEFHNTMLLQSGIEPYDEIVHLEGNNGYGLGMAILTKGGYRLDTIKTHVNDKDKNGKPLFDIDCPEYTIITPAGESVTILDNQLSRDPVKRKTQAARVMEIYKALHQKGREHLVVSGTLNDLSFSDSLAPLTLKTNVRDVSKHPGFSIARDKGREGTYFSLGAYRQGVNIKQKDYLMLSPKLFAKVDACGLDRKGVWQDRRPNWTLFPSIKEKRHAASEHPIIWADLDTI